MIQRCQPNTCCRPTPEVYTPSGPPPDPQVSCDPRSGDTYKQGRGRGGPREHLLDLGRRPSNREMMGQAAIELGKEAGKKIAGEVLEKAVGAAALPVGSAWLLLEGLAELGKAKAEGDRSSEKRSYVRGFLNTICQSLEAPHLPAGQAHKTALQDGAHRETLQQFRDYQPGSDAARFENLKNRVEGYEQGADQAVRLLWRMPPETRAQVWKKVQDKVHQLNPKYKTWTSPERQKQAVVEAYLLQVR